MFDEKLKSKETYPGNFSFLNAFLELNCDVDVTVSLFACLLHLAVESDSVDG